MKMSLHTASHIVIKLFHWQSTLNSTSSIYKNSFQCHKKNQNATLYKCREESQLDATECFIALIICSTCFGHLYAHHQELKTILVLLPHMVCNALVASSRLLGAQQQAMHPE